MTLTETPRRSDSPSIPVDGAAPLPPPRVEVPPLPRRLRLARSFLVTFALLALALIVQLVVVSSLQQRASQQRLFDELRGQLAAGTAPLAAEDLTRAQGEPIAYLEIEAINLRQVVVEGTAGGTLLEGPGHRRDTAFPGHAGRSVVLGRRGAYGGPFARIDELRRGDTIRVTTGGGLIEYRVRGVRRAGDPEPPAIASGSGRLSLVTAAGRAFLPSGVITVDADLTSAPLGSARRAVAPETLPSNERAMGSDTTTLWRLALWLEALLIVLVGAEFAWLRWHRTKAWVVFLPALLLVGIMTAGEATRLLPNLL